MKRSLLGILASLVLGVSAVVGNPASVGAMGVDVAQVEPADRGDGDDEGKGKGDDDKDGKKKGDNDDKGKGKGDGDDKDGKKKGDGDDKDGRKHKDGDRDGDGRRCVGLVVICIG